jgi:hypothetical protein
MKVFQKGSERNPFSCRRFHLFIPFPPAQRQLGAIESKKAILHIPVLIHN